MNSRIKSLKTMNSKIKGSDSKASAPCRIILSGEYFALYGGPAIALAIDKYVNLEVKRIQRRKHEKPKIEIESDLGKGTIYPDGRVKGKKFLKMYAMIFKEMANKTKFNYSYHVKIKVPKVFNGMGLSSALSAAFTRAIFAEQGILMNNDDLYEYTLIGDAVAHGIKPVGIDACTVISGKGIRFVKRFGNETIYRIDSFDFNLPKDTELLVASTYKGRISEKAALTILFAKNYNIHWNPSFALGKDRKRVIKNYLKQEIDILSQLSIDGDPIKLGEALNNNHALLIKGGIVTDVVETVRKIALDNGAFGAKLSGAGGEGALVLIYSDKKKSDGIIRKLRRRGYKCIKIHEATHGVVIS